MEKENEFLIIENLTQEEMDKSFEKFKRYIIKMFADFRKINNQSVKVTDLSYNIEKFIKINMDGIFYLEGKYVKEYSFDIQKSFYTNSTELTDVTFRNPITGINTVFALVIKDIKEFTKKSDLVYKDAVNINIIDDFVRFTDRYFLDFINVYSLMDFNCLYIKKYGRIIQVIGENNSEMGNDYELLSSMNFIGSENRKNFHNIEEILELKFLEDISYEELEKQYKKSVAEKM
ncbi:hypothetical protein EII29_04820 [Leptotrichia sp. OH3620_COT-345]|uniref:hypothetical protein n=1 Tax=Leptotrichia sp. OH3620_COT-345 TaxID=2491048 RepID=UPI000F650A27|nr:hypothetical protein [Leptotrichia sp. OH3620_COT-345]RRD39848.1 hypothetical protein EII29_04820 [Leptotrichia sp. OH3620_COT-345]